MFRCLSRTDSKIKHKNMDCDHYNEREKMVKDYDDLLESKRYVSYMAKCKECQKKEYDLYKNDKLYNIQYHILTRNIFMTTEDIEKIKNMTFDSHQVNFLKRDFYTEEFINRHKEYIWLLELYLENKINDDLIDVFFDTALKHGISPYQYPHHLWLTRIHLTDIYEIYKHYNKRIPLWLIEKHIDKKWNFDKIEYVYEEGELLEFINRNKEYFQKYYKAQIIKNKILESLH